MRWKEQLARYSSCHCSTNRSKPFMPNSIMRSVPCLPNGSYMFTHFLRIFNPIPLTHQRSFSFSFPIMILRPENALTLCMKISSSQSSLIRKLVSSIMAFLTRTFAIHFDWCLATLPPTTTRFTRLFRFLVKVGQSKGIVLHVVIIHQSSAFSTCCSDMSK